MARDRDVRTYSIEIDRPEAEVFAYVSDLTRHGEWSPTDLRVESLEPERTTGAGARYRSVGHNLGRQFVNQVEVTDFEPPRSFGFRAQTTVPGVYFRHTFVLTPTPTGVRVDRIIDAPRVNALFRLVAAVVLPPRRQRKTLQLLKSRLEMSKR